MPQVTLRSMLSMLMAGLLLLGTAPLAAQNVSTKDFTQGRAWLPSPWGPFTARSLPQPSFQDSTRLEDLIRDGKLYLSLQDAIYLALENNLDIAAQRFNPAISQTNLLAAKAGTGGLSFDPLVTTTLSTTHNNIEIQNPFLSGTSASSLSSVFGQGNIRYTQAFSTGTQLQVDFNNNRQTTTSTAASFNPSLRNTTRFQLTQPLLNGFGFAQNKQQIRVAKNNVEISDQQFTQQVMDIVSTVKRAYWELIFARENTKVTRQSFELAEKLYRDNQRQVEIGTLAPLELIRAEAEVARTRQNLIAAQTNALQQQNILKDMIARNPGDQLLATVEIEPIDRPEVPTTTEVIPVQDAIQIAMERRPEIAQAELNIKNQQLAVKGRRNAMLPSVDAFATWQGSGLSGTRDLFGFDPVTGQPIVIGTERGGLGTAITEGFHGDFPTYTIGLSIRIPLRNRSAQAAMARAQIQERQAQVQYKRQVNTIIINVRNSQIALQQNRSQIDAAVKARELQEATLSAEQKRFQLGASTIFLVIQAQRDLAQARSSEIRALVDYQRSLIDFDRALGRTLERSNITLQEAKTGFVTASASSTGTLDQN